MKKIAVFLAVALVLGISLATYAGAPKFTLLNGPCVRATGEESGFAIVNDANGQKTVIQIQVRNMSPGTYYVYFGTGGVYDTLGQLKLNKLGSGHFHTSVSPVLPRSTNGTKYWLGVSDRHPTKSKADVFLYTEVT